MEHWYFYGEKTAKFIDKKIEESDAQGRTEMVSLLIKVEPELPMRTDDTGFGDLFEDI